MTIARLINKVLVSLCICFLVSCNETNTKQQQHSIPPKLTGLAGVVTNLPEKPGYATFNNNCVSCHSARYVEMQPDLSEKTWLALVTKMQKTFGAPIADSSIHEIVSYLVAIKGKS
ncbi:MAG: cytochrome c [Chitinophagaceae bacterium]